MSSYWTTLSPAALTLPTPVAKGDLYVANAAGTITRLGVGSDGQVLLADAASAGGVKWAPVAGITGEGAWAAGTAYQVGDVVSYGGINYLAIANSTGVTPPVATPPSAPIVTTLPATPYDGQEVILVDSLTAPTYSWRLQYSAAISGANKWVFVGGAPATKEFVGVETTASTTYVALATPGPSFALPRAGDYIIDIGFDGIAGSVVNGSCLMSLDIGATPAADGDAVRILQPDAGTPRTESCVARRIPKSGLGAVTLTTKYRVIAGTGAWYLRWMSVQPVRLA